MNASTASILPDPPFELDALDPYTQEPAVDYDDTTIGDVHGSIQFNMWLAETYFFQGADGLAKECLRGAWQEYRRYEPLLVVACGSTLGDRLKQTIVTQGWAGEIMG